ncbi:MAG: transporter permease [Rhodospirillales bacterium]|nr:transporter permease [Rhodospirillales bacterium]
MLAYIVRRVLLIIPTLFAIMVVNFVVIQAAPGGPIEQMIAQIKGTAVGATARISGESGEVQRAPSGAAGESQYRGARGIDPAFIKELERLYGFDKPPLERFWLMLKNYATFNFGNSFFQDRSVIGLIGERLPVSISLGIWTTMLTYLISIPLGIRKAVKDGTAFDLWTSSIVIVGNAIPSFLFAILLVVLFAGGSYFHVFPLRGLVSDDWASFTLWHKITDYLWHMVLPVTAMVVGSFASLTMLTKNCFIEEINKQYVVTARAKGLSERRVLYGHVFRNAMLIPIAGFPGAFVGVLFTSALLIEVIFSLNGLGLLGFEAAISRDYPIMFATLYIFTVLGLALKLISDLTYVLVDPRIDFERRAG